jgi:two-component system chemotaxis response regulator CheB
MGASAGGVETLKRVVANLPPELRATVCIVLHIAPASPSALAGILRRAGPLPCRPATDGEPLNLGEILVAPPDRHLIIERGRVRLSGTRDDGTAGLAMIKDRGGATIVQDPAEALYAGMPASALAHVAVDAVVPSSEIAGAITAMVSGQDLPPGTDSTEGAPEPQAPERPVISVPSENGGTAA